MPYIKPASRKCIIRFMKIDDFLRIEWSPAGEALIEPPGFSPVIADPTFLFPEEMPSGEWTLFAHSAWGIHRYSSQDGKAWRDRGIAIPNAMRPFVRRYIGVEDLSAKLSYSLLRAALPGSRPSRVAGRPLRAGRGADRRSSERQYAGSPRRGIDEGHSTERWLCRASEQDLQG